MKNLNDRAGIDLDTLVSKNVNKKKEAKSWCEKVHFSLMIFVLRKSQLLKERRRELLSQNADLLSPVVCVCGLVLWVPWVIFSTCSPWRQMAACPDCFKTLEKPMEKDSPLCFPPLWHWWGEIGLGKEVGFAISHAVLLLWLKRGSRLQSCQSGTFH